MTKFARLFLGACMLSLMCYGSSYAAETPSPLNLTLRPYASSEYKIAGVYWLPDYYKENESYNTRAPELPPSTPDNPNPVPPGDPEYECAAYGFVETCNEPYEYESIEYPAGNNIKCYNNCRCPSQYKYTKENCKGNFTPGGSSCEKSYTECNCRSEFKYDISNCTGGKELGGTLCTDETNGGKYNVCKCKEEYKYNKSNCNGSRKPAGESCEGSYTQCVCNDGYKLCGKDCIPQNSCCTNSDCSGGKVCTGGICTCPGGTIFCNGQCTKGNCCADADCGINRVCTENQCIFGCTGETKQCGNTCIPKNSCCTDSDCADGGKCKNGKCEIPVPDICDKGALVVTCKDPTPQRVQVGSTTVTKKACYECHAADPKPDTPITPDEKDKCKNYPKTSCAAYETKETCPDDETKMKCTPTCASKLNAKRALTEVDGTKAMKDSDGRVVVFEDSSFTVPAKIVTSVREYIKDMGWKDITGCPDTRPVVSPIGTGFASGTLVRDVDINLTKALTLPDEVFEGTYSVVIMGNNNNNNYNNGYNNKYNPITGSYENEEDYSDNLYYNYELKQKFPSFDKVGTIQLLTEQNAPLANISAYQMSDKYADRMNPRMIAMGSMLAQRYYGIEDNSVVKLKITTPSPRQFAFSGTSIEKSTVTLPSNTSMLVNGGLSVKDVIVKGGYDNSLPTITVSKGTFTVYNDFNIPSLKISGSSSKAEIRGNLTAKWIQVISSGMLTTADTAKIKLTYIGSADSVGTSSGFNYGASLTALLSGKVKIVRGTTLETVRIYANNSKVLADGGIIKASTDIWLNAAQIGARNNGKVETKDIAGSKRACMCLQPNSTFRATSDGWKYYDMRFSNTRSYEMNKGNNFEWVTSKGSNKFDDNQNNCRGDDSHEWRPGCGACGDSGKEYYCGQLFQL